MAEHVTIFETGPRDGLQNEARPIPAAQKARLMGLLSACGLKKIEVTSFVSPQWVPQLADAAEVMAAIRRNRETRYPALIPNLKGLAAALAAGALAPNGADPGPTVCACFDVGRQTVLDFIRHTAAADIDSIGRSLKAGTNCGSCRPELAGLLSEGAGRCD